MSSRHRNGRSNDRDDDHDHDVGRSSAMSSSSAVPSNPTYSALASLRDRLRSTKVTERRSASRELLEVLQDSGALRRLEREAERGFEVASSRAAGSVGRDRASGGGGDAGGGRTVALPWDRVCVLYRSLMDAALLASRTVVAPGGDRTVIAPGGGGGGVRSKRRNHANGTGFTKRAVKFNADDVLFPYKVFLRMDADRALECNDNHGGAGGGAAGWERDWKTRPRYGHHLDPAAASSSSSSGGAGRRGRRARDGPHGRYHALHYAAADDHRGGTSRLSPKEIVACVDYCIDCLADEDCRALAETSLLQWLAHVCARPEYLAALPVHRQASHVLHECSIRLDRAFSDAGPRGGGGGGEAATLAATISQESLLASARCLSALVYNCATRLGAGMHLYVRPVLELVSAWAENAWRMQSEGAFAAIRRDASSSSSVVRRRLGTESDVLSLMPYLYGAATQLLAAHPEQSVPVLADHGHALLRLARRNYARPTTNVATRDALTEYVGAHLTVAETSGRLCGLPEGDLGPLVPRAEEDDEEEEDDGEEEAEEDDLGLIDEGTREDWNRKKKKKKRKKKKKGATLDAKSIAELLEMVRNEKVWESLFSPSVSGGQDTKKKRTRRSLPGRGLRHDGRLSEGGAAWTPLSRRQRRHLELQARLVRVAQRLHISEAEDRGDGTAPDSLELLIERAEEGMRRSGIERGEIDILPRGGSSTMRSQSEDAADGDVDEGHDATPAALAFSPWIRTVGRHLYEMNPRLERLVSSSASMDASLTQDTVGTLFASQLDRGGSWPEDRSPSGEPDIDGASMCERILLESCPMLRALAMDVSAFVPPESAAAVAPSMTQGTLTMNDHAAENTALDPLRPTAVATLQFLAACIECFPRGECWSSSARTGWSAVLDETSYPAGTSAGVLERHGCSPADAAAVVYLLGTTLEKHGSSGGDEDVQLWALVASAKMAESSAVICSREGLSEEASLRSGLSMRALRAAWRYVWRVLFRYDLRYSSYTAGAFCNNAGELVVQLLGQIVRYRCVDREVPFTCRPGPTPLSALGTGAEDFGKEGGARLAAASPFVRGEQGQLWKLPVFEDASTVLSCAPFELISSVVRYAGFSDSGEGASSASLALAANSSMQMMPNSAKDRRWFVMFCLRFMELSIEDTTDSNIRRTFLPFAATCLASLISDGGITSNISTFELDGLTRFATTEDVEPVIFRYDPDEAMGIAAAKKSIQCFHTSLWAESIASSSDHYLKDLDQGLALRIAQGRGAFLNRYLGAKFEREQLRCYMNQDEAPCITSTGISSQRGTVGSLVFEKAKSFLDNLIFQLKYDDVNDASDEDETESAVKDSSKSQTIPKLTGCLSLILTVLLSKYSSVEEISEILAAIFADTFAPAFDLLVENMPYLKSYTSDLLAVFSHLHGIARVFTCIAAFGGGGTTIPRLFGNHAKSLFALCKSLLKDHRNAAFTSGMLNQVGNDFDSDSDDDHLVASRAHTQQSQTQRASLPSNYSDDSDGLMDGEGDDENREYRPRKQRPPPLKRRRMGNGGLNSRKKQATSRREEKPLDKSIDSRGAWACASFMIVLQPSFKCLEVISSHLVWPEDHNHQAGYGTVSKTPGPLGALVCASLFCQKSVILRRDRLDLQTGRGQGDDDDEGQESALILSIEVILQARRSCPPSSKHFMCGLGLVAGIVKIGDYGESCGPIGTDESKVVLEALYPEGVDKQCEDYFLLRQWKRLLKYRSSYRWQQVRAATLSFLYAKNNLRKEFDASFGSYFMYSSFRHIDENVRSLASDVLGAALLTFTDQKSVVSDVLKNAIPRLENRKKFKQWVHSLSDPKLRDELTILEERALSDAESSIEYHSIQCIGLIAGSTSDAAIRREMIWKLIDLAAKKPSLLLPCYRACKRASFLLGFKHLTDMFDGMMPHLLVKWLESQRILRDFPLLLMSPFAMERVCHNLPNELLSMLLSEGGWSDDFFRLDEMEGESHTLNERILTSFVESIAKFLIPNILLSASEDDPTNDSDNERIDATKYLTECVLILTGADSDENVAKVLCNHIADLYGFVAVLADNREATEECENAFKLLKRCVSSVHIERTGAKGSFLVLRHILLLHRKGISIVGQDSIELTSTSFIEGMKYVSKQLKTSSSNRKHASFLGQLGSSLTESLVLVKYWLASSLTSGQRQDSWATASLLCEILAENIQHGRIESGELGFCLHSFITIILDPSNNDICPLVLKSLMAVLEILFSNTTQETLVDGSIAVLHKLTLALLQIHQRAFQKLSAICDVTLCCIEYEQKLSQGLLSGFQDGNHSSDSLGEVPWRSSSPKRDEVLKQLIATKADLEETVTSDTMLYSYGCLEIIATSNVVQLEDILGAEDVVLQCNTKEEVFRNVNEKYSMLSFFKSIQERSTKADETNVGIECEHFIRTMHEHPISSDEFASSNSYSSHDVLARLLALRRLERVLLVQGKAVDSGSESFGDALYPLLLSICLSGDPEESRVISSRCLGELKFADSSMHEHGNTNAGEVNEYLNDAISSIKRTILTMLGRYLLSECAETSLVAMKTAKALLVTAAGKECWHSLDGDIKHLLAPFNTIDDGKLRKEAVRISARCLERLKSAASSLDSESWCWHDELWTCLDTENSCDLWIRKIASSIISCCFGKGSKVGKGDQDFFRICQGLCAKEASFAASIFPALIFHLLDSDARDECQEKKGVRDDILSNIAIGSPNSEMNKIISRCFCRILNPNSNLHVAPQAITVILNTLELLRAITEHRFLTSPDHAKNKATAIQKQNSSSSKKRRSRNASENVTVDSFAPAPEWRGFPYGVVLRVSGLDVAKACFRVKRYYSALYYAEMSMQNIIGTGTFFEDAADDSPLKHSETAVRDISGFGVLSREEENQDGKTLLETALIAQDIIGCCLLELHSKDELQGVLSQGSALNLKQNITSLKTLEGFRRDHTFSMLLDLDNGLQTKSKAGGTTSMGADVTGGFSSIANCLEDLGLNHIKHNYLAGVENHLDKEQRTNCNRRFLREKWFEDALNNTTQWDDSLFPRLNERETTILTAETPRTEISANAPLPLTCQPMMNFYESVHDALHRFARNDSSGGLAHVLQARKSVLSDMEYLAGSEAQTTGMVTHLTKLNVLGQLEVVAKTLEGSPLTFLLNRWGFSDNTSTAETLESLFLNDNLNFDMKEQVTNIDGALFRSIRTAFSVKEIALKVLTKLSSGQEGISNALTSHIYRSCGIYRELGHPDAAKVSLSSLRSLIEVLQKSRIADHSTGNLPLMLRLEDAKILKSQNDLDAAVVYCKTIVNHLANAKNDSIDTERDQICAESLFFGGVWMAQHNVDAAESILSDFEKAAELALQIHQRAPSNSNVHRASMASFKLGEFAANLFNSANARVSSETWKRRVIVAKERKNELKACHDQIRKLQKKSRTSNEEAIRDAGILHVQLSREVEMDNRELRSVEKSIQRYLHLAVESHCNALKLCPTTLTAVAKHVFQLVSLWFKNCQREETKDIVNGLLKSNLSQIPSYRFVPLTYQLFSRIDEVQEDDGFQNTLRDIVKIVCSEHPYHGIVQLLALSNGKRVGDGVNGRHANAYLENVGTSKVDAVEAVFQELRKDAQTYVVALIDSYQTLMNSYMNVAEYDTSYVIKKRTTKGLSFKQYKLDLDSCLSGGRRGYKRSETTANMPAIITKPPPIRPDAQYGNGTEDPIGTERVVGFEPTFDLTPTGLHRPKIVKCIGSKGTRFKQLVKGEDDLRQDAIMEQVFETVNDLLRHEGSTGSEIIKESLGNSKVKLRQLKLVTYGITPLSPASGVLEWVDNTMCFGDFLSDKGKHIGAHSKYFPGEWGSSDVREYYRSAGEAPNATRESKRKAFEKICENYSPAFRFFFLEYFNSSMEAWHTARTLYTRSCAVNSIVGHILGIGDRHTSNILVHTKTGEVVQIDFGIVFEQGKTLTTPELVPFRLTRDVVDGMGPSGTDGVFSKAAEATMGVLRNNADTLLTILSAVVSDPLYKWSLSPLKANQHQRKNGEDSSRAGLPSDWMSSTSDENRNDAADRAIAKIHEKLEGYEDGTSGEHKTVAGQVKLLINEARDPGNLSVMFAGWAPWV